MKPAKWVWQLFMVLFGVLHKVSGAFIGVNIGPNLSNMPSASQVVTILKEKQINHVRLFDADANMLRALSNTDIEVIVGVTNDQVFGIGRDPSLAATWINANVSPYVPQTKITAIAVGNEVLTSAPEAAPALYRAIMNLHTALVAHDLNFQIKVSTPHSMDVISRPFPPLAATFNSNWNITMYLILNFLRSTDSFLRLNAYPYFGYTDVDGIFPLQYALSQLSSVNQIVDPNTLFHYNSMFDAMVDATYYAIKDIDLEFAGIQIVVTETGWPWKGGAIESYATIDNAEAYNNNLVRRVLSDSGPPSQRSRPINTYIYKLFDESWGVVFPNGTSVYPLSLDGSSAALGNSLDAFCIAKEDADSDKLREALNWHVASVTLTAPPSRKVSLVTIPIICRTTRLSPTMNTTTNGLISACGPVTLVVPQPSHMTIPVMIHVCSQEASAPVSPIEGGSSSNGSSDTSGISPSAVPPISWIVGAIMLSFALCPLLFCWQ